MIDDGYLAQMECLLCRTGGNQPAMDVEIRCSRICGVSKPELQGLKEIERKRRIQILGGDEIAFGRDPRDRRQLIGRQYWNPDLATSFTVVSVVEVHSLGAEWTLHQAHPTEIRQQMRAVEYEGIPTIGGEPEKMRLRVLNR